MPKALQIIRPKASNDTYASVVHSFGEANQDLRALAVESVRRSFEIQSQFINQAYATYFSELAKLGRLLFPGHSIFTPRSPGQPHANLNEKKVPDRHHNVSADAKVGHKTARQRSAAHSVATKRKTGSVAKSRASAKRARAKK
jgi:hypothetical protein